MKEAIKETTRRRDKQLKFNKMNNITPTSIKKNIDEILGHTAEQDHVTIELEEKKSKIFAKFEDFRTMIEPLH